MAVAEDLSRRGLTTPKQLGIVGGSNGGLLIGVMLTQRPELFGAVVCQVPLLDMLRYTQLPAGRLVDRRIWRSGDSGRGRLSRQILALPECEADAQYPPVLFVTSTSDDRVHPGHARKMAALMQSQGHDVLFYEETQGGHGGGGDLRRQAAFYATEYLFLQRELEGAEPKPLATAPQSRDAALGEAEAPALPLAAISTRWRNPGPWRSPRRRRNGRGTRSLSRLCADGGSPALARR